MIHANVVVNYNKNCHHCEVSPDIFQKLDDLQEQNTTYCQIEYPTYSGLEQKFITNCKLNKDLQMNTITIKSNLLNITPNDTYINKSCNIRKLVSTIQVPSLTQVTLLFNPQLYDKLKQLASERDILEFVSKKFNIEEDISVVHSNELLSYRWCKIIDTKPYYQGTLNFKKTKIVIVKDIEGVLENSYILPQNEPEIMVNNILDLSLKHLKHPLRFPETHRTNTNPIDLTLAVFADKNILEKLSIVNGSYVELYSKHDKTKSIANIFALTEPHKLEKDTLYITPRLKMTFKTTNKIQIQKVNMKYDDFTLASNVSLSRVNDLFQNEKGYQNIISSQLKNFFLWTTRIVKVGDFIPITFDSTLSTLPETSKNLELFDKTSKHDNITWFKVDQINNNRDRNEEIEQDNDNTIIKNNTIYRVVPNNDLKITTKGIHYEKPLTLSECDYASYFSLPPTFKYKTSIFSYTSKITNVINSILECIERKIPLQTPLLLHSTSRNTGKGMLVKWVCNKFGLNRMDFDCLHLLVNVNSADANSKILGTIKGKISNIVKNTTVPMLVYMSHLEELFNKIDPNQDPTAAKLASSFETEFISIIEEFMQTNSNIIFIFSTNNIDELPLKVRTKINFEIEVNVPSEAERKEVFTWYLSDLLLNFDSIYDIKFSKGNDIDFTQLAIHSAGLTPLDIKSIIQNAKFQCYNEVMSNEDGENTLLWNNNIIHVTMNQLKIAINTARDEFSVSIGAPKIPNVTWDDIGGVDLVKGEIMDTIDMPLRHPELFSSGSKQRSGILFYGPPGTGKTLMAKAIATNFSLNFFSVKGPELLNMYIGESEANVRRVFQKAREARPCVIFFDEIDSVAPKRGNQGDSGGVMDRIVSQLLAELDGMSGNGEGVFVIGATNRPDLLDEALLRPGRFDKLLYLGISDTNEKQHNILKALTRKFTLAEDVDLTKVVEVCPFNYTGADFYALCSDSMLNAMTRVAKTVDSKVDQYNKQNNTHLSIRQWFDKIATEQDITVSVQMEDFLKAQAELVPSVSPEELNHYLQVKSNFES
ncbi:peroxisomal ATPase Pex6p [Monosporozyma unispora]